MIHALVSLSKSIKAFFSSLPSDCSVSYSGKMQFYWPFHFFFKEVQLWSPAIDWWLLQGFPSWTPLAQQQFCLSWQKKRRKYLNATSGDQCLWKPWMCRSRKELWDVVTGRYLCGKSMKRFCRHLWRIQARYPKTRSYIENELALPKYRYCYTIQHCTCPLCL